MAALAADGRQALDVSPGQGGGRGLGQLHKQVLSELGEEGGAAAGYQVAKGQDGALPDRHPGTG